MKNRFNLFALGALGLLTVSCANQQEAVVPGTPVFSNFVYTGQDAIYDNNPFGCR